MANHSEENDHGVVDTLSTIFKKVGFFGYRKADLDLDVPFDTATVNMMLDETIHRAGPQTDTSKHRVSAISHHQQINYANSDYSNSLSSSSLSYSSGSSIALGESYSSTQFQDEYSDTEYDELEEDEEEEGKLNVVDQSKHVRRRRPTGVNLEPTLPEYTMNDVAQHDMIHDCWIILYDKVYDVTQFLYEHPGGEDLIMEHAGRDGTMAFRGVGHSKAAVVSLKQYLVGELPSHERIFSAWDVQ